MRTRSAPRGSLRGRDIRLAADPAPGIECLGCRGSFVLTPASRGGCDVSAGTGRALFLRLLLGFGCPAFGFGLDALLGQREERTAGSASAARTRT